MADDIVTTKYGKFRRVCVGFVCYRDEAGNFRKEKIPLYREIPEEQFSKSGLTYEEAQACRHLANNVFAELLEKNNVFEELKAAKKYE